MGKGKSSGQERAEKLSETIKQMEEAIQNFQPEYDEKKKQLDDLTLQIEAANEDFSNLFEQARKEVRQEMSDELEAAKKEKESIEALVSEYQQKLDDLQSKINQERKQFEDDKKESDEAAKQYSKSTRQEADKYAEEKKAELDSSDEDISEKEKKLTAWDKKLLEKEHAQAALQNDLDKKQADAELGFQTLLREERVKFDGELTRVKAEIAEQGKKLIARKEAIDDELKEYKETELAKIDSKIKAEKDQIEAAKKKNQEAEVQNEKRRAELDTEAEVIQAKKEAYDRKFAELDDIAENKLQELYQDLLNEKKTFQTRCNELEIQKSEKQDRIVALTAKLKEGNGIEISTLKEENRQLKEQLENLRDSESSIFGKLRKYKIDSGSLVEQLFKIEEYDSLMAKIESLTKEKHDIELQLRQMVDSKDALEMETKRANQFQSNYESATAELERLKKPGRKERLSSFTAFSDFDPITQLDPYGNQLLELTWLKNIKAKMEESQIEISDKLLYAFHTSVKIHDWSPLVVLAGVSGTGKSELPRQYAHHGGMNFISVPVKPDWDSMQSLFGYYNSIENKFEPTELSKALFYMQSSTMKNTVLMVLLDEMNLAYVELYFSDLLSKFETNRGTDDTVYYEISLGANETPEKLEIGKNVLWVGTMNEDETTKALSDKVVDRSTLLTFPRPTKLVSRRSDIQIAKPEKRLTYNLWSKWCSETLSEEKVKSKIDIEAYRKIVEDINEKMSKVNRNLGHRVWQSIERYVFSHPMTISTFDRGSEFKKQFNSAFAEAIAFKVMPKLRGIEVSGDSKKVLEEIKSIIDNQVSELSEDYKQAMSLSSHIFQWCSAKFMDVKNK